MTPLAAFALGFLAGIVATVALGIAYALVISSVRAEDEEL